VLECAVAAGLAPIVECCEPRHGILVARWTEGRPFTPEQVCRPSNLAQVAQLVRRIHSLKVPADARVMTPAAWIDLYQRILIRHGIADPGLWITGSPRPRRSEVPTRLEALADLPLAGVRVLCHSDLHPQNVLVGAQGLSLLDWEYAHVAEPFWDLAGWIRNNDLSADDARLLLASYLGRPSTPAEAARFELLAWLYDYVCLLWSGLYLSLRAARSRDEPAGAADRAGSAADRAEGAADRAAGAADEIYARAQLLAARLDRETRAG
jgi:thiamine kinase-like enzyme